MLLPQLSLLLLVAALAPALGQDACASSISEMLNSSFAAGERGFYITHGLNPLGAMAGGRSAEAMWTTSVKCVVKDEEGALQDPTTELQMKRGMFWLFAQMACRFSRDHLGTEYEEGECEYPGAPSSLTAIDERGAQDSWFGPLVQMPTINGEDLNDPSLDKDSDHQHTTIEGVQGSGCTFTGDGPPAGDDRFVEKRSTATWYDGGMQLTVKHGSYLTMRAFMFKTDEDREAAIKAADDTKNAGLQYASTFGGTLACAWA